MTSAGAVTVLDPTNDFIPTFAGAHSADLDVQSVFATYDGVNLHIGATLSGNVGTISGYRIRNDGSLRFTSRVDGIPVSASGLVVH